MLLTFWVHGRGIGEEESLGFIKRYYKSVLEYGRIAGEWAGLVPASSRTEAEAPAQAISKGVEGAERQVEESGWLGGFFGGFNGLRGGVPGSQKGSSGSRGAPPPGTYKIGEVHGDYVKVS